MVALVLSPKFRCEGPNGGLIIEEFRTLIPTRYTTINLRR